MVKSIIQAIKDATHFHARTVYECASCGAEFEDGRSNCPQCHQRPVRVKYLTCSKCGQEIPESMKRIHVKFLHDGK